MLLTLHQHMTTEGGGHTVSDNRRRTDIIFQIEIIAGDDQRRYFREIVTLRIVVMFIINHFYHVGIIIGLDNVISDQPTVLIAADVVRFNIREDHVFILNGAGPDSSPRRGLTGNSGNAACSGFVLFLVRVFLACFRACQDGLPLRRIFIARCGRH
jgi:hypothetical protein